MTVRSGGSVAEGSAARIARTVSAKIHTSTRIDTPVQRISSGRLPKTWHGSPAPGRARDRTRLYATTPVTIARMTAQMTRTAKNRSLIALASGDAGLNTGTFCISLRVPAHAWTRSHSKLEAQFRQQGVLPRTHVCVRGHDLLNRRIHLLLLAARGESVCQQQGLFLGLLNGLNERPHTSHRRVKFALPIKLVGVSESREQLLQLLVFDRRQMAVGIHRQDQQVKQCPLLGGRKTSEIYIHVETLPDVDADCKAEGPDW